MNGWHVVSKRRSQRRRSAVFLDEIAQWLVDHGVGVLGQNIFKSSSAVIPSGDGPYMTISETGGTAPVRVQNGVRLLQCPTAQILVVAKAHTASRDMSRAAYAALDGVFNTTVEGCFYTKITVRQEPTDMGLDELNRARVVFNIDAEKSPS
jgi:hypothetical protein